jgi:hypothetical protein
MSTPGIESEMRAANPIGKGAFTALDLAAGEAALGQALLAEAGLELDAEREADAASRRRPRSPLLFVAGVAATAAIVALVLLITGGASKSPVPAYGAELVRFAESTPLLLLEGPAWQVRNVNEQENGEGQMEFTRASPTPHPGESLMTRSDVKRGITPPAVRQRRQRRVELTWHDGGQYKLLWHDGKLGRSFYDSYLHKTVDVYEPGHSFMTTIPALGVKAYIDPGAETNPIQGGPGDRLMVAIWREDHHLLELRASVPSLDAFRERLGWLRRVDTQAWLDAMPARVVKAADYGATAREILQGIPLPPGFDPAKIPDRHLTTDRYQVGAAVGGAVACAWFDHWGESRADHNSVAVREAKQVLSRSEDQWPIFRQMSEDGAYPALVVEYAKAMPSGRWHGKPLLPVVDEGLGCTANGFPLRGGNTGN